MRRQAAQALLLLGLHGAYVKAQDVQENPIPVKQTVAPTVDSKFLTLTSFSFASALYDAQTTLGTLERCHGLCFEENRFMRPFVGNAASAYAFTMGLTSVSAFATYRLKQKGARWWWVPMAATSILHVTAG